VLAVARVVPYGDTIEPADLRVVEINDAKGLDPIGSGAKANIVGKRAAVELRPGTLLTSDQVTERINLRPGDALVVIPVEATRMPVRGVTPGTQVLIAAMAAGDAKNAAPVTPDPIQATVLRSSTPNGNTSGRTVLDVAVPRERAEPLAARVFTGQFALIVLNTGNADAAPNSAGGPA
jgi:hypothetical protein